MGIVANPLALPMPAKGYYQVNHYSDIVLKCLFEVSNISDSNKINFPFYSSTHSADFSSSP